MINVEGDKTLCVRQNFYFYFTMFICITFRNSFFKYWFISFTEAALKFVQTACSLNILFDKNLWRKQNVLFWYMKQWGQPRDRPKFWGHGFLFPIKMPPAVSSTLLLSSGYNWIWWRTFSAWECWSMWKQLWWLWRRSCDNIWCFLSESFYIDILRYR